MNLYLLVLTTGLFGSSNALAEDCSASDLRKEIAAASPARVALPYSELAQCSPADAKRQSKKVFGLMLPGPEANRALLAAIELGQDDLVMQWVGKLRSDERSSAVKAIGLACPGNDTAARFLTQAHTSLGDKFWDDRWYRSLATCRHPEIQELLRTEINEPSSNRGRFFGVLEVYSRNLGPESIDKLLELAGEIQDPEELTYVVNAFADAAQVGAIEGQDISTTKTAVDALVSLVPTLDGMPLEQSRTTLESLGALDEAARVPALRYAELLWEDGRLHYGVVAVETARCKNGKVRMGIHTGSAVEKGVRFPNTIAGDAPEAISFAWVFKLAEKCKGRQTLEYFVSKMPSGTLEEIQAFHAQTLTELENRAAAKRYDFAEEREVPL